MVTAEARLVAGSWLAGRWFKAVVVIGCFLGRSTFLDGLLTRVAWWMAGLPAGVAPLDIARMLVIAARLTFGVPA